MFSLIELGWSSFFQKHPESNTGIVPGRVAEENRQLYRIFCEQGEFLAELSGKLRHEAVSRVDLAAKNFAASTLFGQIS